MAPFRATQDRSPAQAVPTLATPSRIQLLWRALGAQLDNLALLDAMLDRHGERILLPTPSETMYFFSTPGAALEMLGSKAANFPKSHLTDLLRPLVGDGLVTASGETWKRQRQLIGQVFRGEGQATMLAAIERSVCASVETFDARCTGDLVAAIRGVTFDAITQGLIGYRLADGQADLIEAFHYLLALADDAPHSLGGLWRRCLPGRRRRAARGLALIDEVLFEVIEGRRATPDARDDFVGLLLAAAAEGELSDRQVRDEIVTMFAAGHETLATSLLWALQLLGQHPDVEAALVAQVRSAVGDAIPTLADLPAIPLASQVFCEAMRLYPSIWALARRAIEADTLDGVAIPPGGLCTVSIYRLHRNPRIWNEPDAFRPQRFADATRLPPGHWIPFSLGPRRCIGQRVAMAEGALILAGLVSRYEIRWRAPRQRARARTLLFPPADPRAHVLRRGR